MLKLPEHIEAKILARNLSGLIFPAHLRESKQLVFTNGCFDLLHQGHLHLLSKAKDLGDLLVVGLNSDNSVRRLKGPSRPVNDQDTRIAILASLVFVDFIVLFHEDTPENLIQAIKPDILVKGGDYNIADIVGADFVRSYGGKVFTVPLLKGFSTTRLIDNSKK